MKVGDRLHHVTERREADRRRLTCGSARHRTGNLAFARSAPSSPASDAARCRLHDREPVGEKMPARCGNAASARRSTPIPRSDPAPTGALSHGRHSP